MIQVKRVYEPESPDDGLRLLVDRMWPRGLSKEKARIDKWLPEVAPSSNLRKWFSHDPSRWQEFCLRYERELEGNGSAVAGLMESIHDRTATFLFSSRETRYNNAVALKTIVENKMLE